eukprot:gene23621-26736_t
MEQESIESQCAHLLYHSDDVVSLQTLLQGLSAAKIYEFPTTNVPGTDRTFLMACAKQGRVQCCKLLLSLDSAASVNTQNAQGYTALHYASYQGHIEVAFLLLAAGADWRLCNVHGETAYQTAISGKKYELANRFQISPYFADNYYPPVSSSGVTMSKHEASMFKLEIIDVESGGDKSFIGLDFHCLAATQRALNSTTPTILSGSAFEATGCMQYSCDDLYIGRARSNHICIADLSLSKQHAVVSYIENMGFVVHDIGSKHGTFVNKKRLVVFGTDISSATTTSSVETATASVVQSQSYNTAAELSGTVSKEEESVTLILGASEVVEDSATTTQKEESSVATKPTANTIEVGSDIITPPVEVLPTPTHSEYLLEGMLVQFGRIHCKVVRKKQDYVISGSFQPASTVKEVEKDSTLQQHHFAVQQRVRALLNVPDHVTVHTSGQAVAISSKTGKINTSSVSTGVAGQKRKISTTIPVEPVISLVEVTDPMSNTIISGVGKDLLQKFGWKEGTSLGKHSVQANQPIIPIRLKDRAGLGNSSHISAVAGVEATGVTTVIDEDLDSEKTKAWKRMMARFSEAR